MQKVFFLIIMIGLADVQAQNERLKDGNNVNWLQLYFTAPINDKADILAEYQWRRTNGFKQWQQSLLRGAVQYKFSSHVSVALGYGWIETFPYGDFPIASNGTFPEHRVYQQLQVKSNLKKLLLSQRLRIEQ